MDEQDYVGYIHPMVTKYMSDWAELEEETELAQQSENEAGEELDYPWGGPVMRKGLDKD